MLKVKQLIEYLSKCDPERPVIFDNGDDIKHIGNNSEGVIILSSEVPTKLCNKCGENVFTEKGKEDYPYYCPTCQENMFECEVSDKAPFCEE